MLNVFMNTWRNYNENGADNGEWIALPMEEEELEAKLEEIAEKMKDSDPEWFINDYEWITEEEIDASIDENEDIIELNDLIQRMDELDDYQTKALFAIIEAHTSDLLEALDIVEHDNFLFYEGMDLEEVAEEIIDMDYFNSNIPSIFRDYFDYEAFARDLGFDGYDETSHGVIKVF